MTELLVRNAKIVKANNDKYSVYNFGIPAYQSESGLKTCPLAGKCAKGCYAQAGAYIYPVVRAAYEWRLAQTLLDSFTWQMGQAIAVKEKAAKCKGQQLVIRIHDSGDFYSASYVAKWLEIVADFPDTLFYAYTKMVPLFHILRKQGRIPANLVLIYSTGGLADSKIDITRDRHTRVFGSLQELEEAGYSNAMDNDLVAAMGPNHYIRLVYHGHLSRTWTTAA
jgi:hypothetical protein